MRKNDLTFVQDQIGYEFKNKDLLQQAFIRRSYSEENGGENNEVLEFVGDKVLDLVVVKLLTDMYGCFTEDCNEFISDYQEDRLTEIKTGLVKKETLANCIDNLGLADYLILGKGDLKNNVQNEPAVKEDLFEAILGAVALDANWNLEEMQSVVEIMLDMDSLLESGENINYIQEIQEWVSRYNGSIPRFHFKKSSYESTFYLSFNGVSQGFNILGDSRINKVKYHCLLKIDDSMPIFRGFGESKKEARSAVCEVAYNYLENNNKLFSIRDEIENPRWEQAINQLEILARRDYFSIPIYNFIEQHDKNGNPVWSCECHIKEEKYSFSGISSSKKDAKKDAAYSALKYVLGIEEE